MAAGQASINASGNQLRIQQASDRAVINWASFNVGRDASVQFQQPGAGSVALNRILGNTPSQIEGSVSANGRLVFVNPMGMVFAHGAKLDAAGLAVFTRDIVDPDFRGGKQRLESGAQSSEAGLNRLAFVRVARGGVVGRPASPVAEGGAIVAGVRVGSAASTGTAKMDSGAGMRVDGASSTLRAQVFPGDRATADAPRDDLANTRKLTKPRDAMETPAQCGGDMAGGLIGPACTAHLQRSSGRVGPP